MPRQLNRTRGHSMVEVLVALLLLSLGSLGLVGVQSWSSAQLALAGHYSDAGRISVELLGELENRLAAAASRPLWEQVSGCDKACDVETLLPPDGTAIGLLSTLPGGRACLINGGDTMQLTLRWYVEGSATGCGADAGVYEVRLASHLVRPG